MNKIEKTQQRIGRIMLYLAWLILLGLLTVFFNQWLEQRQDPNRNLVSYVNTEGVREVVLQRNHSGHYLAPGLINGKPVRFLIDTGASLISIPAHLQDYLGLERGSRIRSMTANGTVTVYTSQTDEVRLGDIILHDVPATLNPYMETDIVLLGMSFIKDLEINQRRGILTLRQY